MPGEAHEPGAPGDEALLAFAEVMRRLRAECPWKREQTHRSLSRYLLEETHETLEAIDSGAETGDWTHLREELGDLLLQVYFHAVVAEESGAFTLGEVAAEIEAKMRRRNPHVFGDPSEATRPSPTDAREVDEIWQRLKAEEKQRSTPFEGLPPGLPALLLADKVLGRVETAASTGAVPAALHEQETPEQVGADLLAVVARARAGGVDPEQALRDAVRRLMQA